MSAPAGAGMVVTPYLQNPTSESMTISWFSYDSTPGTLTVQTTSGPVTMQSAPVEASALFYASQEVPNLPGGVNPGVPYLHRVKVTGLQQGSSYDYSVSQGAQTYANRFRTAPAADSSVRFIVYADSETEPESTGSRVQWSVPGSPTATRPYVADQTTGYKQNLMVIESRNPDFIGIAGDLVESGGEQRDWDEFWRHNAGDINDVGGSIPILAAPGNHEDYGGPPALGLGGYSDDATQRAAGKFQTYFDAPDNGSGVASYQDRYFRMDYGPITYISLDVTNGLPHQTPADTNYLLNAPGFYPDFNPGSPQYEWLKAQLADAQAKSQFTFVQFHHVPYSVGVHGLPAGNGSGFDTQSGQPVRVLTPLFEQYGVDAVFAGHDEMYQHSLVNGIHFYDIGIGGDGLRGPTTVNDGTTGQPLFNPHEVFLAHTDALEVWNGAQLLSGGKHYGHLEANVFINSDGFWTATLDPVYIFPLMDTQGNILGWERRLYNDSVTLLGARAALSEIPEPSTLVLLGLGLTGLAATGRLRRRRIGTV